MTAPSTPDLVARLLAAIEETERDAQAAIDACRGAAWFVHEFTIGVQRDDGKAGFVLRADNHTAALGHIARQDPKAILRHCAADRETLDGLKRILAGGYVDDGELPLAEWMVECMAAGYGITEEAT